MPLLNIGDDALWCEHDNAWLPVPTLGARLRVQVSSGVSVPVVLELSANVQNWRISRESKPTWKALLAQNLPRPHEHPSWTKGNRFSVEADIAESSPPRTRPEVTDDRSRPKRSRKGSPSSEQKKWPAPIERPWYGARTKPDLVVHADWNTSGQCQWFAQAKRGPDGVYRLSAATPVGAVPAFISNVLCNVPADAISLAGFDFGIGLPLAYAERIGCSDFKALLPQLGGVRFPHFFTRAITAGEISLDRPFYPVRTGSKGETSYAQLLRGLGLHASSELLRECERQTEIRRAASPLFWCVGAQQVGPAVISGWRELLQPLLLTGRERVRLWPFDGELDALLMPNSLVVVETYPREFYGHLGVAPVKKKAPDSRRQAGKILEKRANSLGVVLSDECRAQLADGFNSPEMGEDDGFDAVVGLLGMLNVLLGRRSPGGPSTSARRAVEGWIFGQ